MLYVALQLIQLINIFFLYMTQKSKKTTEILLAFKLVTQYNME